MLIEHTKHIYIRNFALISSFNRRGPTPEGTAPSCSSSGEEGAVTSQSRTQYIQDAMSELQLFRLKLLAATYHVILERSIDPRS